MEHTAFKAARVHRHQGVELDLLASADLPPSVGDANRPNSMSTASSSADCSSGSVDGAASRGGAGGRAKSTIRTRLLLDCMGHYSVSQGVVARPWGSNAEMGAGVSQPEYFKVDAVCARSALRWRRSEEASEIQACAHKVTDNLPPSSLAQDIVKQMRGLVKPDGVCMVVGSCAEGFPRSKNTTADLLYTLDDATPETFDMQVRGCETGGSGLVEDSGAP